MKKLMFLCLLSIVGWSICIGLAYLTVFLVNGHIANFVPFYVSFIVFSLVSYYFYRYQTIKPVLAATIIILTVAVLHAALAHLFIDGWRSYQNSWYSIRFHLSVFLTAFISSLWFNRQSSAKSSH